LLAGNTSQVFAIKNHSIILQKINLKKWDKNKKMTKIMKWLLALIAILTCSIPIGDHIIMELKQIAMTVK